jgi:ADP-ribose pyrophosphatase
MKVLKTKEIEKLKYLKSFEVEYETKSGKLKKWELVSRQDKKRLDDEIFRGKSFTDGAMIFATDKNHEKVVILKEFRVSAGKHVYMFPAGLINNGEDISQAGTREFKEETGMNFEPVYVDRERYVSIGIINEKVNVVYGYFTGKPSKNFQEDNEEAEIFIIDKKEAIRILSEEEVSIRTAAILESFYGINPFFHKKK